jgi:MtN3 and saliva related transmembrane protein
LDSKFNDGTITKADRVLFIDTKLVSGRQVNIEIISLSDRVFMEFNLITTLGIVAGMLTTFAYLPQAIKTWKSKSANDLSWSMLIILSVGIILWLIYGFSVGDIPIILANVVTFILTCVILAMKIRYKNIA